MCCLVPLLILTVVDAEQLSRVVSFESPASRDSARNGIRNIDVASSRSLFSLEILGSDNSEPGVEKDVRHRQDQTE